MAKHQKFIALAVLLALSAFTAIGFMLTGQQEPPPPQFALFAQAAIVMDLNGQVLFGKEAQTPMRPSSTTKLLAAAVILDEISQNRACFDDLVTISQNAVLVPASQAGFAAGDVVSVEHLIMAAMLPSGSEATVALGEHFFGSDEKFAAAMNNFAQSIGMYNTYFTNSVGLDLPGHPDHYTTAYDLAILARFMWQNQPIIFDFTSRLSYVIDKGDGEFLYMQNTNDMLHTEGVTGLKTGSGPIFGANLVFTYDGQNRLIFVVMGSPDAFLRRTDSHALLEGFR